MTRILFFNFDGTDNEPADAMQDKNLFGVTEDDSITNILKFHLLLGGTLQEEAGSTDIGNGSRSFYYNGVGTYGNFFQRKFNAGLAAESADVSTILRIAKKNFREYYDRTKVDYIVVTGFSRGAALARRFAALINDEVSGRIIIEGVFDTVASIGLPNLSSRDRPSSDVVFEDGYNLPSNVLRALHLLSLDDKRRAFQPTLMNKADNVTEVWFPGAHSDVGGGYNFDGLSDNALRYFLDWFEDQEELAVKFKAPRSIDYKKIFRKDSKLSIGQDDVQIDPNPFGVNHEQERNPLIEKITLTHRKCCVIRNDKVIPEGDPDGIPTVHWSVAARIGGNQNYRPKSLHNVKHKVLYADMETINEFTGFSEHKLKFRGNLIILDSNNPKKRNVETRVYAHRKYNHTSVMLEAGRKYAFEVLNPDTRKWRDGDIEVDGEGWDRGDVSLGLTEIPIAAMEPFRRVTGDGVKWFTLCGCIGEDDAYAFSIGNKLTAYTAPRSGELCAFANDLEGYYGNNSGYLLLRITAKK